MVQIVLLFLFCTGVLAQYSFFARCPNVTVKQNFDVPMYMGAWYEFEKYFAKFELGKKCIVANYTLKSDGSAKVVNSQINSITRAPSSFEGTVTFSREDNKEAKLSVVYPNIRLLKIPFSYVILDTDYENFSVIFSCSKFASINGKFVWIMTRKPEPTQSVIDAAYKVFKKNKLSKYPLIKTNQKRCPFTP